MLSKRLTPQSSVNNKYWRNKLPFLFFQRTMITLPFTNWMVSVLPPFNLEFSYTCTANASRYDTYTCNNAIDEMHRSGSVFHRSWVTTNFDGHWNLQCQHLDQCLSTPSRINHMQTPVFFLFTHKMRTKNLPSIVVMELFSDFEYFIRIPVRIWTGLGIFFHSTDKNAAKSFARWTNMSQSMKITKKSRKNWKTHFT